MKKKERDKVVNKEICLFKKSDLKKIKDKKTKNWLSNNITKTLNGVKNVSKNIKRETLETLAASKILLKIISKSKISDSEIKFLKDQSVDIVKALALIGLQAVPGSSIGIIILEKFAKSKGFTLFPKKQNIPNKK